jgi:hypothetical protein
MVDLFRIFWLVSCLTKSINLFWFSISSFSTSLLKVNP